MWLKHKVLGDSGYIMLCIFFLSFLQVINSLQGPAKKTKKLCDAHEGYPVNFMRGFLSSSVFWGGVGEGGYCYRHY